jgi:hypothetical protein
MLTFLLSMTAHAAAPLVLHSDDVSEEEAGTRAAVVDGQTASQMSWANYRATRPTSILGESTLKRCSGVPSTMEKVNSHLQKAHNSLDYMENETALGHLRAAKRATGCATERVTTEALARNEYLHGLIMFNEGKPDQAKAAWRQALAVLPELQWDPNFEPSGQPAFDDVRENLQYEAKAQLRILPAATDAIFLDGKSVDTTVEVMGGDHLLQITDSETTSMWLNVTAGDSPTILTPSLFAENLTGLVSTPESRRALRTTINLMEPERTIVVLTPDAAWKSSNGGAWIEIAQKSQRSARRGGPTNKTTIWTVAGGLAASAIGTYAYSAALHRNFEKDFENPAISNADLQQSQSATNAAFFTSIGLGASAAVVVGIGLKP